MTTNPLLNLNPSPDGDAMLASDAVDDHNWQSVLARDRCHDGVFVFAVSSTGIYCRPSCPAKHPRRTNVTFFRTPDAAEKAGYRACLRCKPKVFDGDTNLKLVKVVCRYIEQHLDESIT